MRSKWLVPFVLTGVACGGAQEPVTHANPPPPPEEATSEPEPADEAEPTATEPTSKEPSAEPASEAPAPAEQK